MTIKRKTRYSLLSGVGRRALVLVAVSAVATTSIAQAKLDFTNIKRKACAPLQQQYDQAIAAAPRDTGLAGYRQRMAEADVVAEAVLRELASFRADFVARTTATVDSSANTNQASPRRGAVQIYQEAMPRFAVPVPLPRADAQQQSVLLAYYAASVGALERCIVKYAVDRAAPGASAEDAREIRRLCMVLPLLMTSEEAWTSKDVEALPDSMKAQAALDVAEECALRVRRPMTAYQLHCFLAKTAATTRPANDAELLAYVRRGADIMLRSKDIDAAKYYLSQARQIRARSASGTANLDSGKKP